MSLILDYLKIYEDYSSKDGCSKVIVLMQVGSFFECYSTNTRGPNLEDISQLLNLILTRRDKSILIIDEKNPKMMGFPCISLQKNLKILIENNYTVVVVEQVTNPPNPKREITGIFSPSTYIEETREENIYLVVMNIQTEKQKEGKDVFCIGITAVDLNIGKVFVDEIHSSLLDEDVAFLKAREYISKFQPKELILYSPSLNDINKFEEKVDILRYNVRKINEVDKAFHKVSYQSQFLKKIYQSQESEMIDIIELLDLERKGYATLSLVLALDFVYRQNEKLLKDISKPLPIERDTLFMGNNTIFNLNLISNEKNKFSSLFEVINLTNTIIGKRMLKERLINPETNIKIIKNRYNQAISLLSNNQFDNIIKELKNIKDLQRYIRRTICKTLHPVELFSFYSSIKSGLQIYSYLEKEVSTKIIEFIDWIENRFILDIIQKFNLKDILESFYKFGIYVEIDELLKKMELGEDCVDLLIKTLNGICKEDLKFSVKNNKKEGQFLIITKKRGEKLEEILKAWDKIEINESIHIRAEDLEFSNTKSQTKIRVPNLGIKYTDPMVLQGLISNKVKEKYFEDLEYISSNFLKEIEKLTIEIAEIDFNISNASLSKKYNYIPPVIDENQNTSFISFENLRHPIIERLIEYEYIPQSFEIGKNIKGMLLYGLNSSGKSSFQKSVGLSLILAQAGLFVPATSFSYYPYRYLFTRIDGNDNLFKGLSSFTLEMMDLKNILKYKGESTLIIGDEVCKGTEYLSANSILASTILTLSQNNTSFIFATHLHDIPKIKQIKELNNIGVYHLDVEYIRSTNELIFERKLKEGQGEEIYGILVASNIIQDNQFIELTNSIKNEMKDLPNHFLSTKISRYNKDLFVDECELCKVRTKDGSNFETHHLLFQKDCKNGFSIEKPHIPMNSKMNLIVLCEKCHHKIHSNEQVINTFKQTNKGKKIS